MTPVVAVAVVGAVASCGTRGGGPPDILQRDAAVTSDRVYTGAPPRCSSGNMDDGSMPQS